MFSRKLSGQRGIATCGISFHGHAFGEVPWFIDVAAELDCEMISEKLKRHHSQDGHYVLGRFRQHDNVVSNFSELLCAISAGHGDSWSFAGFYLFDVVEVFGEYRIVWRDKYRGQIRANQR